MKNFVFSIDVESDLHTGNYESVTHGIKIIENLLNKYEIKGIFFTTCDCIEKYPEIFRRLAKQGHEIALHGYRHVRFDELSREEKTEQIKKAKTCFKKYLGFEPKSFRAPQHSIDKETLDILEKEGFEYDSSYTPLNLLQLIFFPEKPRLWFEHFFSPRNPYKIKKNLVELPPTSLLLPFVSLPIRVLPLLFLKFFVKILGFTHKNVIFYCHSWDFIEVKGSKIEKLFSHEIFAKKLDSLLAASAILKTFSERVRS